ncbi:MAG TPA: glycosyltransferase family 39 protein [Phycisphaerae bacterium]|nr:glycosyltransferase family 39 protein [Phycisphaerae bacterium]
MLVLYGACLYLPWLGAWPLASHEALAAERAREMTTIGGWVIPHLRGEPDIRKPPLPFWISGALAAAAGGMSEWTARLPSVAASLGTMLLLVGWMRRVFGWRTAIITGVMYLTGSMVLLLSRRAEVDMQLCFWTTAAVVGYWFGIHALSRRRQVAYMAAVWLSLALGMLTKGPLPLAILSIVAVATAVVSRDGRRVGRMLPVVGPLIFLGVLVPWGVWVETHLPGALTRWYAESLGRYAGEMGHEKPAEFYLTHAPLLVLPWVLPAGVGMVLALKRRGVSRTVAVFLMAWAVGGLVFLTLGVGKRIHYALCTVPPLMAFAGLGMDYLLSLPRPLPRAWRWVLGSHVLLAPAALAAGLVAVAWFPDFRWPLRVLGVLAAAGLTTAFVWYARGRRLASLGALAATVLVTFTAANGLVITPLMRSSVTEARIGRFIHDEAGGPQAVAFYRQMDPQVLFYAGRGGVLLETKDDVAAWCAAHPGGYLIVHKGEDRDGITPLGPWQEVLPGPAVGPLTTGDFVLLKSMHAPDGTTARLPARTNGNGDRHE